MAKRKSVQETAETMARKQRDISVSEFFLKNRHLLGFDNPRRAIITCVKEAVDNALDACEEASILPEISVDLEQSSENRFRVTITDNGPGIVKAQIPKIFARLLYGSKFHRLRMSRGQQGIGISAAGMYGQLTTGTPTRIHSSTGRKAYRLEVMIDARSNRPSILKEAETDWRPSFYPQPDEGKEQKIVTHKKGTAVSIEMEATYARGKLSVDAYIKQCAIVNPHLQIHYRVRLLRKVKGSAEPMLEPEDTPWTTYRRVTKVVPEPPGEIAPHPHGVELGTLMQMLKDTGSRTLRGCLQGDFSRVSSRVALELCERAGLNPKANPRRIAHRESEALYAAIAATKLMRPPTDCLAPIGEEQMLLGLKKEVEADFYTAVTRPPAVYRGNPFQLEVAIAYAKPGENAELLADEPVRVMRFANRVPLLYMGGACAMQKSVADVNWKNYGLSQPRGSVPSGPLVIMVHMASVWVPFTSESKEAVAHYPEIIKEAVAALQECGRKLSVYLNKRKRASEQERKLQYIATYIPHLALGLQEILDLSDKQKGGVETKLQDMLRRTHLET